MKKRFYYTDIIRRLEQYIHCDVGKEGFEILLYGWVRKHRFNRSTYSMRDYLSGAEIVSFSEYAGYDLSKDPQ